MSFPRYPEYKDSGVEWLGAVPAHWAVWSVKRVAMLASGDSISSDSIRADGEFPVFGGNGLRGYTESFTHEGTYPLIGRQGALCGNVNYASGRFWASEHAVVVRPVEGVNPFWLGETLRAMNLNQYSVSAAQPGLAVEAIGKLRLPVPPTAEQTAIAAFLDRETAKIDALVAEQEKLIALLKGKRQAVISHAVTKGLANLPGANLNAAAGGGPKGEGTDSPSNPDAPMKPSGIEWLGDVPAHWEVVRMATLFREASDIGGDNLPILSVSIHDGVSDKELDADEMERKVTRSDDRSMYKAVRPGDLAYNMMRAWQGGFGSVTVPGQVSPAYIVARPVREIRTAFVEQLLRTPQAVEQMRRHSRGITDFRLRLYWEEFKNIYLALPSLSEQDEILRAISVQVKRFDGLVEEAQKAITLLKERRSALISAAVTGQIDVRGLAIAEAT
ncbi:MAG: restriction endonuclease subunit S [Gammaproteobacteria bacterium]|nr:restriction endonuclease subunit S [Gammaproteobacteria bacterium]